MKVLLEGGSVYNNSTSWISYLKRPSLQMTTKHLSSGHLGKSLRCTLGFIKSTSAGSAGACTREISICSLLMLILKRRGFNWFHSPRINTNRRFSTYWVLRIKPQKIKMVNCAAHACRLKACMRSAATSTSPSVA